MHTEPQHLCPLCSEKEQPAPAPTTPVFHIQYHAPAGVLYQPLAAETPAAALSYARDFAQSRIFKAEDFEPDENSLCIQQIVVMDENSTVEQAAWTDPDSFAQLHADEILEELEDLIEGADELSDAKQTLDSHVSDVIERGEQAAKALENLRRKGGAQ